MYGNDPKRARLALVTECMVATDASYRFIIWDIGF
jgi:hypothetical protein